MMVNVLMSGQFHHILSRRSTVVVGGGGNVKGVVECPGGVVEVRVCRWVCCSTFSVKKESA